MNSLPVAPSPHWLPHWCAWDLGVHYPSWWVGRTEQSARSRRGQQVNVLTRVLVLVWWTTPPQPNSARRWRLCALCWAEQHRRPPATRSWRNFKLLLYTGASFLRIIVRWRSWKQNLELFTVILSLIWANKPELILCLPSQLPLYGACGFNVVLMACSSLRGYTKLGVSVFREDGTQEEPTNSYFLLDLCHIFRGVEDFGVWMLFLMFNIAPAH